jgi:hypothetical protein
MAAVDRTKSTFADGCAAALAKRLATSSSELLLQFVQHLIAGQHLGDA